MDYKNIIKTIRSISKPYKFRTIILQKILSLLNPKSRGYSIFDENWDNIVILDACRFDIFQYFFNKLNLSGNLEKKISRGAHTISFLQENFNKRPKYKDIIYITANPYVSKYLSNSFYKIIPAWKNGWNETEKTVLPKYILKITKKMLDIYPNKKFIIHFMQPHYPYIKFKPKKKEQEKNFLKWYSAEIYKSMGIDRHLIGYINNLKIVLNYVNKIIDFLTGKIIITSDHGEAFGEFLHPLIPIKFYGHRVGVRIPVTIEIPWLVINKSKKQIKTWKNEKESITEKINELKKLKII